MRFIHIADVHLGMTPDAGKPWSDCRAKEITDTFHRVIEMCNIEEVDLLFIAGDLFHRQPLLRELKEVNYAFSKLKDTKVVLIAGNHDFISQRSHYGSFIWNDNVFMMEHEQLEDIYFQEINTRVYGFSYHTRNISDGRLNQATPGNETCINILLAHGGDERNNPINMKHLSQAGFDYVALGHIHKPQRITERIAFAGSLEPLDKNEVGSHGYILGEIDREKGIYEISFLPMAVRQYIHLRYEVLPDMTVGMMKDDIKDRIGKMGINHIYKLILTGIQDPSLDIKVEDFYKLGNIVEVVNEAIPDYDFAMLQYENRDNIIGMFIDDIRHAGEEDEIADKALYYGTRALLERND